MKLKRKWPAYCIWVLFIIFDVLMVASSSFFLGLFPSDKTIHYTVGLTVLGILFMNVLTLLLGKLSDRIGVYRLSDSVISKFIYGILLVITLVSAFIYRLSFLSNTALEVSGKFSLYENAVIGGSNVTAEYDMLSIFYQVILKGILFFTGNDIAVALIFEIVCYCLFMLFAGLAVYILLGAAASIVFELFAAFMPIFTDYFRIPTLSTDNLFYAMVGLELYIVALYLKGIYKKSYKSYAFIIWYLFVGAVIGFMGYMDAGTFITITPFVLAGLFICGSDIREEMPRFFLVLAGAAVSFAVMIMQEQGIMMGDVTLAKWASYYFHHLNTFSLFMIYTNYKIIYLVTVIVMSGIIIGFWKSRKIDRIAPWLFAMLIIYVTVPFMGATRMNSQIVVTIFYGLMLSCLASLIVTAADDDGEIAAAEDADEEALEDLQEELQEESQEEIEGQDEEETEKKDESLEEGKKYSSKDNARDTSGKADTEGESEEAAKTNNKETVEETGNTKSNSVEISKESTEKKAKPITKELTEEKSVETIEDIAKKIIEENKDKLKAENQANREIKDNTGNKEDAPRFVPEGMVLPMETEADAAPHNEVPKMKMPKFEGTIALDRKDKNKAKLQPKPPKDDFDLPFNEGDDFDI